VRLAADAGGRLIGLGHEALVSNLPGEKFAEPVTQATEFLYGGENRLLKVEVARISRLTAGSVRAPGEAVGMQVLEAAMDELAEKSASIRSNCASATCPPRCRCRARPIPRAC
jgi:xanthine dehydrogenase YagR molybdenum-binding subunit